MLTRMKHAAFLLLCVDTQLLQTSLQALGISGADLYSSFQCPACLADWLACNENHYETIMLISWARRYLFSRFRIVTTHSGFPPSEEPVFNLLRESTVFYCNIYYQKSFCPCDWTHRSVCILSKHSLLVTSLVGLPVLKCI